MVRLDTNSVLTEAIAMYERAGYRAIERYNDNPYARAWFEKGLRVVGLAGEEHQPGRLGGQLDVGPPLEAELVDQRERAGVAGVGLGDHAAYLGIGEDLTHQERQHQPRSARPDHEVHAEVAGLHVVVLPHLLGRGVVVLEQRDRVVVGVHQPGVMGGLLVDPGVDLAHLVDRVVLHHPERRAVLDDPRVDQRGVTGRGRAGGGSAAARSR